MLGKVDWAGKESVIDLGCGDGKVTARIAGLVPRGRVLGIDSAPPMIRLAVQKYPPSLHSNLAFRQMDVLDLDFHDEFDVAFSNAALHWVKDQRRVLIRVAKTLRPGGRILFQMGGAGNARLVLAVLDELILQDRWQRWFTGFDFSYGFYHPRDYDAWLFEAGLKPLRTNSCPKT